MAKRKKEAKKVEVLLPKEHQLVVSIDVVFNLDDALPYNMKELLDNMFYTNEYSITGTRLQDKESFFDF